MSKPPKYLHKYFSLADEVRRGWLRECIENSTLFCSSPLDFNDPFESRFLVEVSQDPSVIEKALTDPDYRQTVGLPRSGPIDPALVSRLLQHANKQVGPVAEPVRDSLLNELAVCCFARKATSPLLWAHYASGHTGVCLRFDTEKDPSLFRHAHQVKYQASFPRMSLVASADDRQGEASALTKAAHWRYESEWRVLLVDAAVGPHPVHPDALNAVILGWRTTGQDRDLITSWIAPRRPKPKVLQIIGRLDRYHLQVRTLGAT